MKKLISLIAIFSTIFLIGCNNKQSIETSTKYPQPTEKTFTYPYTGETTSENISDLTPYLMIIENSISARPQSGLSDADIVYETSAEGGIPRFLALFHKNSPNKLGPIRSVRPYFLTLSKEHALPIAHCGGSSEALKEIKNNSSLMSLNEMSNSSFYYRDTNRTAPHNLYSSSDSILKGISSKNYNISSKNFFDYSKEPLAHSTESATDISVITNRVYTTDYKFEKDKYTKYMDGDIAMDANTNTPLSFKNIIIQRTNITLNSDGTHLDINLIGSGDGFLFVDGKKMNITWNKDSEYDKTRFYDSEGNNLTLAPGNTIVNIIDTNGKVQINN